MEARKFIEIVGSDFFTGVPDSLLKGLCDYLIDAYDISNNKHIIGVNEGNCVALAAGYHLATQKYPLVYLQNSGLGNIINPVVSLLNEKVYGIPMIFVIGWRGEPGEKDEPQHIFQGEITEKLLNDLEISYFVLTEKTEDQQVKDIMLNFKQHLSMGKQVAFLVKKDGITFNQKHKNIYQESYLTREEAIDIITGICEDDLIVSTTGKTSRELFELREFKKQTHKFDFLTVGSMGHSSSIALGIALNVKSKKVWIIDGDGALLMHMGSIALIGATNPNNLIHIVINNGVHESVGGQPTPINSVDITELAKACSYKNVFSVSNSKDLENVLSKVKQDNTLSMIEVRCTSKSRNNLGRPTTTARENKEIFTKNIMNIK